MFVSRREIIDKVKVRLDELVPFDEGSIVLPENALLRPIHALIESKLDNATLELLERAPLYLLTSYEHNLYTLAIGEDKVAYLNMPDDFLRLALLWLRGWHRPVQAAISRENPLYRLQRNQFTRGGNAKPVAVLADYNPLLAAKWMTYQCQREMRDFAEANTGYEVALMLEVNEHSFSPLNSFDNYPELTAYQFVWLSEQNRQQRTAAFMSYVSRLLGVDIYKILDKGTPDIRENYQACNILDGIAYIQVSSNNINFGTVTGSGWYNVGSTATVRATTTNIGIFEGWYENDVLSSSEKDYSFTVAGNKNLVAKFKLVQYTVTLQSEDTNRGIASGGGTVDAGEELAISAAPKEGWKFDAWYYNGEIRREDIPQHGVYKPHENCMLVVRFKKTTAEITALTNSQNLGTTTGGGTYEIGSTCTLAAMPIGCYRFVEWREDGVKASDKPTYSFTVTTDRTLTAVFDVVLVTISMTCDSSRGTATVNEATGVTVERCSYVNLKATPKQGWKFAHWRINGVVQPQLGATASYQGQDDVMLEAIFEKPTVYVYAEGYDTMNIHENHKYYGKAYIGQAISCPINATCYLQIGNMKKEYTAYIPAGDTSSTWSLVYESIPDPDLNGWGCTRVIPTGCDGMSVEPSG